MVYVSQKKRGGGILLQVIHKGLLDYHAICPLAFLAFCKSLDDDKVKIYLTELSLLFLQKALNHNF